MIKKIASVITLKDACLPPKDYDMRSDGITQSMCSNFLSCPQRGMLAINRWIRPNNASSTRFGSLFHEMLDKMYSSGTTDIPTIEKMIDKYLVKHGTEWGSADKAEFDSALSSALLQVYVEHWSEDFTKKKFAQVEQTVKAEFSGFKLRAKIDGEYTSKTGSQWLMEHKTKSRFEEDVLLLQVVFNFQNLYYRLIWQQLHPGKKLAGTLYNIVRKPQHKMKGGETLAQFRTRLIDTIRKDKEHFFKRYELAYTPKDDKRFCEELVKKLQWIENFITGKEMAWRNEFACERPYRCEFLEACSKGNMTGYMQKKTLFTELDAEE